LSSMYKIILTLQQNCSLQVKAFSNLVHFKAFFKFCAFQKLEFVNNVCKVFPLLGSYWGFAPGALKNFAPQARG